MDLLIIIIMLVAVGCGLLRVLPRLIRVRRKHQVWSPAMVLVAVGAQHPLRNGTEVGDEYKLRLYQAIRVYTEHWTIGGIPTKIMVCGSLHRGDEKSLWQAGREYLVSQGISEEDIIILDSPCYNCMDECRLFIGEWRSRADLTTPEPILPQLILVDPAHKALRNQVAFAWMAGWLPKLELTQEDPTPRQRAGELGLVLYTLLLDPDWQGPLSLMRWVTWRSRRVA